jgi:hypothetical protein
VPQGFSYMTKKTENQKRRIRKPKKRVKKERIHRWDICRESKTKMQKWKHRTDGGGMDILIIQTICEKSTMGLWVFSPGGSASNQRNTIAPIPARK